MACKRGHPPINPIEYSFSWNNNNEIGNYVNTIYISCITRTQRQEKKIMMISS